MSEGSGVLARSYALDNWDGVETHERGDKQVGNENHFDDDTCKKLD